MLALLTNGFYLFGINLVGAGYILVGYLILVFGALILGRENFSWVGLSYFLCALPIAFWLLCLATVMLVPSKETAFSLSRLLPLGFITPIPLFYHALTIGLKKQDQRRQVIAVNWLLAFTFVSLGVFTDFIVKGVQQFPWGNYPEYSWSGLVVSAYMSTVLALILLEIWVEIREAPQKSRQRAILVRLFIGVVLTGLMILDALPAYGINVPPFGFVFALASLGFFGYTITNYSLDPISPEFAADEIIGTMRDGVIVTDREGSIRMVNHATSDTLEYDESDLRGRSIEWLTEGNVRGQELAGREMKLRNSGNNTIPVTLSSSRLEDWGRNHIGWVMVFRDISDRKEAEEKLRETEERFRQLTENLRDVFWLYDRDREEYLYWSPAVKPIFNLSMEDAPTTIPEWESMVDTEDDTAVTRMIRALRNGRECTVEYRISRDGESRWIRDRAVPVHDEQGNVYRMAGLARDVTEVRRKNEVIREKNRELEQFAYAASHDLREPLRQLLTFCEFAEEDLESGDTESLREDLADIRESARAMEELIQALLQLSRAGRDELSVEQVDLRKLLESVRDELEDVINETNARLKWQDDPGTVRGDQTLLKQVLLHLITNALKYNEGEPTVEVVVEEESDRTVVGVRDDGIGIDPEQAERIFRPFERLHGEDEYEGTGMGLGICRKIVERHGGEIWLDTDWTKGTFVKFSLPDEPGSLRSGDSDDVLSEDVRP